MMNSQSSWPDYCFMDFDAHGVPVQGSEFQFSSSLDSPGDSPDICSIPCFPYSGEDALFGDAVSDIMGDFPFDLDELGIFSNTHRAETEWLDSLSSEDRFLKGEEGIKSPSMDDRSTHETEYSTHETEYSSTSALIVSECSTGSTTIHANDDRSAILHLLRAHGDAMDKGSFQLGEVIARRIRQTATPSGAALDRFGFYLFCNSGKQSNQLKQESGKNYKPAFRAVYDICPHGRLPHFVANGTILESLPADAEIVHIADFDMGEGLQWLPLIEAVGRGRLVRITSMRIKEDDDRDLQYWSFDKTRRNLLEFARGRGLRLTVEEMEMEELATEKKRTKKKNKGGRREWMVFNCMTDLPHMGKKKQRHKNTTTHARNFLRLGKELLSLKQGTSNGIIVFGNGDGAVPGAKNAAGFGRHFDGCLQHFRALFESMEWHFPSELSDARITIESLFVAPSISSLACFENWAETREACVGPPAELEPWRLSNDVLQEAMGMVRGRGPYSVKIAEERGNEMVLEFRGTPLVKVSAWR
ncbi:hypothetical protein H6P81_006503 [Aristolochia fimbriata]|uniref:Uncharacterized protein n=1 Tax=Aristolochia fimbriata TaxID=158543 RepID=A0AAV7EYF0_ARIFI|nr:hypothetical protein H6P81_006503 [Aristolochia fimbriata]